MSSFFSKFVRSLGQGAEPPAPDSFEELLDKLRRALVHELKKRSLWQAPPSYLGVYGSDSWIEGDVLEELLLECYLFIFVRRLQGLQNQLSIRKNIDGLIFLNIRHFLYETQKRCDPLGFRTFEMLQEAVLRMLAEGAVHLLAGDPKIRNDSVLGFSALADPQSAHEVDLRSEVTVWNSELLPELITAWNREPTLAKLQTLIAGLAATDVEAFQFQQLIEPMKEDIRGRWHAIQLSTEGESAVQRSDGELMSIVQWIRPELGFEHQQSYQKLVECVTQGIEKLEERKKTLEYLHRLWLFLHGWVVESESGSWQANQDKASDYHEGHVPSDKKLGELLRIPRGRIPSLKMLLGRLIEACRKDASGLGAVSGSHDEAQGGRPVLPSPSYASKIGQPAMGLKERREALRLATGKAAIRGVEGHARPPQAGDRFVLGETDAYPGEWVLVKEDPANAERVLVVPMDGHPLVGSRDVTSSSEDAWTLRCGLATWIDVQELDPARRVGLLKGELVEQVRLKVSAIADGTFRSIGSQREVDAAPEYLRWTRELAATRAALPGDPRPESQEVYWHQESAPVVPFRRHRDRPKGWRDYRVAYAIAATFAVAMLGASFWAMQLRSQLLGPVLVPVPSGDEIVFRESDRIVKTLALKATVSHVSVYLILAKADDYPAYRIEVLEKDKDDVLWASGEMTGETQFLLALPRHLMTAEEYRFRLYGRDEGGVEEFLEEREVRVLLQ